jgi:hypothetical protein
MVWLLLLGCANAGGTETGNPAGTLKDFQSSACKSKADSVQQPLALESDLAGLQCIEWERQATGTLKLRLSNFPESCAERYRTNVELSEDGVLSLRVYTDSCSVARCGTCLFDFDYELAGIPSGAPLSLRTGSAICASQPTTWQNQLTLPLDERETGIVCRQLASGALSWHATVKGVCGQRNMPCGDCSRDKSSCVAGTTCSELAQDDSRCLATCTSHDDCVPGATRCEAGVCRAAADF